MLLLSPSDAIWWQFMLSRRAMSSTSLMGTWPSAGSPASSFCEINAAVGSSSAMSRLVTMSHTSLADGQNVARPSFRTASVVFLLRTYVSPGVLDMSPAGNEARGT